MSEYVLRGWVQNPMGEALPGISVAILTQPADTSTEPGSPLATLYAAASFNTATVSAASWSAGQITFTLTAPPPSDVVAGSFIFIDGVSPTGYNTTVSAPWEVVSTSGNNVVVAALTNPGTYSSGGSLSSSAWPNPTTTDGNGYWFGYADPGFYTVQQYGASLSSQLVYPDWQNALSAAGTVTSVALTAPGELTVGGSPVTSSGTLALTWTSEAQNLVLASPTGGSGAPTFRALALSDLPASFGTVSSVGFTSTVPTFLIAGVSGSPVTSTGTISLALSLANQSANNFFAGPTSGGAAAPTFRPMVIADLPATGTASSSTFLRGDGTWASATGTGGGTVTSVAMTGDGTVFNATVSGSPITASGTLAPALLTQTANFVFAGPTTGAASAPTFRALVIADLPATGTASSATFLRGDGTWASPTGTGTVTSVSMSGDGTVFNASVSGSPITGSGTLAPSLKSQVANVVLAGPTSGGSAAPTFRAAVIADLPFTGTPSSSTFARGDGTWAAGASAPAVTAIDLTAQSANIAATTILTPGSNGFYRVTGYTVLTTAASSTSTLPQLLIDYTDADSNHSEEITIVQSSSANLAGTVGQATVWGFYAKSGGAIKYRTSGYTSNAAGMQYAVHIRLEGPF